MIRIYKSDTGQFVLLHAPTQTVIIDENLDSAYSRMTAFVREHHPTHVAELTQPFEKDRVPGAGAAGLGVFATRALLVALVLLPFLWLMTLHSTIGGLLEEVTSRSGGASTAAPAGRGHAADGDLTARLQGIEGQLTQLGSEVAAIKSGPASTALQRTTELQAAIDVLRQDVAALRQGAPPPAQ